MTQPEYKRKTVRKVEENKARTQEQAQQFELEASRPKMPGLLGWMVDRPKLLGWLELLAAIILVMLALKGFLDGAVWMPFGFGLLGLRFFYAYIQHNLGVQLGKVATPLNLVLLVGALICLVLGFTNEKF